MIVQVNALGLVVYENAAYEDSRFGDSVKHQFRADDGPGLSLNLSSAWGTTQRNVQPLWSQADASGLARNTAMGRAQRFPVGSHVRAVRLAKHVVRGLATSLLALASLAIASPAQAQRVTTFVSNTGQVDVADGYYTDTHQRAQQFTTGDHAASYTLTEVVVDIGRPCTKALAFALHRSTTDINGLEVPGARVVDLIGSAARRGGSSFVPASAITLTSSTKYFVRLKTATAATNTDCKVRRTLSRNVDNGAASGWDIADRAVFSSDSGATWINTPRSPEDPPPAIQIAIKGTTPAPRPPGQPGLPDVRPGNGTLEVSWPAVSGADGYTVQWKSGSEAYGQARQRTVETPRVTLAGLTDGAEHIVRVRASNAGGDSDWSEEAVGTPQVSAPERPGPPDVTPGDGTLEVSWTAVTGADSYTVQWKSGSQEYSGTRQQTVATPQATLTGLTDGAEHTVRVRASNAGGDSDWSEEAVGTPQVSAPERPGPPDVTPGDGTLEVSWTAVTGADSYTVQWKSGSQEYSGTRQQTVATPQATLTGLTDGAEHTVRVRASNTGGDGDWSEEAAGTPMTSVPALPPAGGALLGLLLALLGRLSPVTQ